MTIVTRPDLPVGHYHESVGDKAEPQEGRNGARFVEDLGASEWTVTTTADNSVATSTKTGEANKSHYVTAIYGSFSAAAIKLMELKDGSTTIADVYVHNSGGIVFARPVKISSGNDAVLAIAASGTGGVVGAVVITGYTK